MNAWISSASATATATVMTSSIRPFMTEFGAPALGRRMTDPLEESDPIGRPVGQERLPDDPLPRHRPPEPAVLGTRAVAPHHVVIATRPGDRLGEAARLAAVALHDVGISLALAVADHVSVPDRYAVAGKPDDTLDERLRGRLLPGDLARPWRGLSGWAPPPRRVGTALAVVLRGVEHNDVPHLWGGEVEGQPVHQH